AHRDAPDDFHELVVVLTDGDVAAIDALWADHVSNVLPLDLGHRLHRDYQHVRQALGVNPGFGSHSGLEAGVLGQVVDGDDGRILLHAAIVPRAVRFGHAGDLFHRAMQHLIGESIGANLRLLSDPDLLDHGLVDFDFHLHLGQVGEAEERLLVIDHGAGAD